MCWRKPYECLQHLQGCTVCFVFLHTVHHGSFLLTQVTTWLHLTCKQHIAHLYYGMSSIILFSLFAHATIFSIFLTAYTSACKLTIVDATTVHNRTSLIYSSCITSVQLRKIRNFTEAIVKLWTLYVLYNIH